MVLDANGNLRLANFSGVGSRFLQTDLNGNLIPFAAGTSTQVLYGNGTWGALPTITGNWLTSGNDLYWNSGNVGIGAAPNPAYKLDVAGDARIQNNLIVNGGILISQKVEATNSLKTDTVHSATGSTKFTSNVILKQQFQVDGNALFNGSVQTNALNAGAVTTGAITVGGVLRNNTLAGSGIGKVYTDAQGNLFRGSYVPPTWECTLGSPNWNLGGNNFSSLSYAGITDANIGTCDDVDFILKSNNTPKIWLKNTSGNEFIGFGTSTPNEKFHFNGGNVRVDSRIAIGTTTPPEDLLHVGNGLGKVVIGQAIGMSLNYGTGYIGFNASRNASAGTWATASDGANNGGTAIFGDVNGDLVISTIASTGNSAQNLTDANIITKRKIIVTTNGPTILNSAGVTGDAFVITNNLTTLSTPNNTDVNFKVKANGLVYSRELNVQINGFPDYVFKADYKLMGLDKLETYIKANKHLPNVPTADEIAKNGANLGELSKIQMEKIEELTLYVIELKKEVEALKKQVNK